MKIRPYRTLEEALYFNLTEEEESVSYEVETNEHGEYELMELVKIQEEDYKEELQ